MSQAPCYCISTVFPLRKRASTGDQLGDVLEEKPIAKTPIDLVQVLEGD